MIVDDALFMRTIIRRVLEKEGIEVVGEAENGHDAVMKYQMIRPDIVTMDITMPGMSGIDALKAIRQFDPFAKIIMVTAQEQDALLKESFYYGAQSFIVKPFKEQHIVQTVRQVAGH